MRLSRLIPSLVGLWSLLTAQTAAFAQGRPLPSQSVVGLWQQVDDQGRVGAWFLFSEVNGEYQGRIAKAFPRRGEPVMDTCQRCPGNQRGAKMVGLAIVSGMKRQGLHYGDGNILDPRDGSVYSAEMDLSPDGQTLQVRGYLGLPLFGQTQVWTRLPDSALSAK